MVLLLIRLNNSSLGIGLSNPSNFKPIETSNNQSNEKQAPKPNEQQKLPIKKQNKIIYNNNNSISGSKKTLMKYRKLKGKENGQHSDCDICFIEDIEKEKRNKLKDNIKCLEDISIN